MVPVAEPSSPSIPSLSQVYTTSRHHRASSSTSTSAFQSRHLQPPSRPPRIPRLRPTSAQVNPSSTTSHSPMSISSAITTTSARLHPQDHGLESLDLSALFGDTIHDAVTLQDDYRYLDFRLKGDLPGSMAGVESYVSYHDGGVYRILDCERPVDLLLEYAGSSSSCSVSQLIIRSPYTGNSFMPKRREGMVLISHDMRGLKNTQRFDDFSKHDFDEYREVFQDDRMAAWFKLVEDRPTVIDLQERSGCYILIKLFPTENELVDTTVDLLYIALLGCVGARSFAQGKLL
ncbi:hypothetical protein DM01DRAFT_1335622 [Hesseltinella vesiculosa]|uniref:Uncharacterized protein n=1 Tax=Hesseltinella vesiculosa TaxID=101127 RepID=A0A1X2GIF0_9FUNG|nr:hypothetical protein DM01DRAFT_1335622 [Hesseltinella vesiculosa]